METIWIWVWYILTILIIWLILSAKFAVGMPIGMGFLVASIFGLIVGLFLIPYYSKPSLSSQDKLNLEIFVWVSALLPLFALGYVIFSSEYTRFWNQGKGNCFTAIEVSCDKEGECNVDHLYKKCPDKEVLIHNHE